MTGPHEKFARVADRLITKNGRPVTLQLLSRTPEDAAKPWRGPDPDPEEGIAASEDVIGVFTDYKESEIDGVDVRRGDKRLLVAAKASALNLETFDIALDAGTVWRLFNIELLEPGTTRILYTMTARQ